MNVYKFAVYYDPQAHLEARPFDARRMGADVRGAFVDLRNEVGQRLPALGDLVCVTDLTPDATEVVLTISTECQYRQVTQIVATSLQSLNLVLRLPEAESAA